MSFHLSLWCYFIDHYFASRKQEFAHTEANTRFFSIQELFLFESLFLILTIREIRKQISCFVVAQIHCLTVVCEYDLPNVSVVTAWIWLVVRWDRSTRQQLQTGLAGVAHCLSSQILSNPLKTIEIHWFFNLYQTPTEYKISWVKYERPPPVNKMLITQIKIKSLHWSCTTDAASRDEGFHLDLLLQHAILPSAQELIFWHAVNSNLICGTPKHAKIPSIAIAQ